jgi:hypothetical protein
MLDLMLLFLGILALKLRHRVLDCKSSYYFTATGDSDTFADARTGDVK